MTVAQAGIHFMIYPPADVHAATGERRLDALSVVESGVVFETVHAFPVLQQNFDKLGKREDFYKKKMQRS